MTAKEFHLTDRQKSIYDYICQYQQSKSEAPTIDEITSEMGLKARSGVVQHLLALEKKGLINRRFYDRRGIDILHDSEEITIYIKGVVPAGMPIECQEDWEPLRLHPAMGVNPLNTFALRVAGDSMIDAGINDGDVVLIKRQSWADDGQIVVASVDGEQTLKQYVASKDSAILTPCNKRYQACILSEDRTFAILGVLLGVLDN
jgi:repressor LexA